MQQWDYKILTEQALQKEKDGHILIFRRPDVAGVGRKPP